MRQPITSEFMDSQHLFQKMTNSRRKKFTSQVLFKENCNCLFLCHLFKPVIWLIGKYLSVDVT